MTQEDTTKSMSDESYDDVLDVPTEGQTPTTREIQLMLKMQSKNSKDRHAQVMDSLCLIEDKVEATKQQAEKTNGRVNKLEFWRNIQASAVGLILGVITFLVPYIISIVRNEIRTTVEDTLSAYNINIDTK
jgi:hypothetical protein